MALASFAPAESFQMAVTQNSSNIVLPTAGSPTTALVLNQGNQIVFVALGGSTVLAAAGTSLALTPGSSIALTIGSNTYLAAATLYGLSALNITVGS